MRISRIGAGEIFSTGLHEFVINAISVNNRLSEEIAETYHFQGH
ncbi:MAG: hypothetical protein R3C55_10290 [Parvularculaceae bacterium]